ncbi:MAG: choice-of-anchor tandem repeat GloVer-containing protein [Luteolibacter sp.]
MKIKHLHPVAAILTLAFTVTIATAHTPVPLPVFETVQGFPLGAQKPTCKPVRDAAGNFYGTTYSEGAFGGGTVFKVGPNGDVVTLHHFDMQHGALPTGLTVGADGNYYGATQSGGAANAGTIFKITPSGAFTVLHEFDGGTDGGFPVSRLLKASDGNFYGTTSGGGAQGLGTFYKVTPAGSVTTLVSWNNDAVGWVPNGDIVQANDGNFYGTNRSVNVSGHEDTGAIFRISPSGVATAVASLASLPAMDFCLPDGLMQASDGNFYGTTYYGGSKGRGTIYKVTPAGVITFLVEFGPGENDRPAGSLTEGADGCLYGTSHDGGTGGGGTIFKITTSGILTTLVNMEIATSGPSNPWAGLAKGPDGTFYGTSETGGAFGRGTLFKLGNNGAISTLATFYGDENHAPHSALLQTRDGSFYGTTSYGGYTAPYTVFKMSPGGTISTVADLPYDSNSTDSYRPAFVEGKAGIIFGTQIQGGANLAGSVFKLDHRNDISNLISFDGSNGHMTGGVVIGDDGNLYGTNQHGGTSNGGTIFRMTQKGGYSLLAEFNSEGAAYPNPGLIQASDGNFYGTTQSGGAENNGTVFKMTPSGVLSTLAEFGDPNLNGRSGNSGLIEGSDHNFYGLLPWGGPSDAGAVYKVTPSGVVTTLAIFTYTNGAIPAGQLIEGPDGAFYGVTPYGGTTDDGTVFRITKDGELTTVFNFDHIHGRLPLAGLTLGNDGSLYGATSQGGVMADGTPAGGGQIYRLRFGRPCR